MNKQLLESYTLKSKDIPLVEFSLYAKEESGLGTVDYTYVIEVDKIHNDNAYIFPKNLPIEQINDKTLLQWLNKRKAPKNRQFVDKILAAIEDNANPLKYVDVSHALSLNDAYWVTKSSLPLEWEKMNLYTHAFDEALSLVAFTGNSTKIPELKSSPELTSSGALKKCWSNRSDGIYLIKGDSFFPRPDGRSQATMEFYAAQVANVMDFNHIAYNLEEFHHSNGEKEIVCICKLFTSEKEGYVEAATYFKDCGIDFNDIEINSLSVQDKFLSLIGPEYADMMLFDSIIGNHDRHFGNFGMIVDNDTGKYLRPAPLFDNGYSLLYGAAQNDFKLPMPELMETIKCKYFPIDRQAKLFVEKRHLPKLRKLLNFTFEKHPKYNITDDTLKVMSEFVRARAQRAIQLFHEKANAKSLSEKLIQRRQNQRDSYSR